MENIKKKKTFLSMALLSPYNYYSLFFTFFITLYLLLYKIIIGSFDIFKSSGLCLTFDNENLVAAFV